MVVGRAGRNLYQILVLHDGKAGSASSEWWAGTLAWQDLARAISQGRSVGAI